MEQNPSDWRQKRAEELRTTQDQNAQAQQQAIEQQLGAFEKQVLAKTTREAAERYHNIKFTQKQRAVQALITLKGLVDQGVKEIDDALMKRVLSHLHEAQKKDFTITRK